MRSFKDKFGQEWKLDLSLDKVYRIESYDFGPALRKEDQFFLQFFPPQEELFDTLLTDPRICFGVIWCMCEDQLENKFCDANQSRKIASELDFTRCFDGSVLSEARIALYEELPNFFQDMATTLNILRERVEVVQKMTDAETAKRLGNRLSEEKIRKQLEAVMEEEDEEFDKMLAALNRKGKPSLSLADLPSPSETP